ncbi:MAG: DUF3429 domain-containing protein [Burkholderiales bacterium]|jgi:hypothetical protein
MTPAWAFGLAGLIPFVFLAGIIVAGPVHWYAASQALLTQYGALILSFVGALHWAYAVQQGVKGGEAWLRFGYSVLPALVAWLALQFPLGLGMQILAMSLMACLVVDLAWLKMTVLPVWFIRLRAILTIGGSASLLMASVF